MNILGFNLKSKVDRYKFIILFSGTLLFILVGTAAGLKITSSSGFCSLCHAMAPEVATWKASSHSQVACTECHIEPGVKNMLKQKAGGVKSLYAQVTGNFYLPIRQVLPLSSEVCLKCHNLERDFSPGGDLIIPHKKHYEEKISCVRCHSGVAHGNIAQRRATITTGLTAWNSYKGKQEMNVAYTKTPMDDCMKCHQRRKGPLECSACHKTSKKPISHKKAEFKLTHGKEALTQLDTCNLCHGYSGYVKGQEKQGHRSYTPKQKDNNDSRLVALKLLLPSKSRTDREVVNYSRNNSFCLDCHSKRPESHKSDFENNHGVRAKTSSDSCFTCHSNRSEEKNPVKAVTCSSCHPSTHYKRNWKQTHPIAVKGKIQASCLRCHSASTCTTCHTSLKKQIKPSEEQVNNEFSNQNQMEGEFE